MTTVDLEFDSSHVLCPECRCDGEPCATCQRRGIVTHAEYQAYQEYVERSAPQPEEVVR